MTLSPDVGSVTALVDGAIANTFFWNSGAAAGLEVRFDFRNTNWGTNQPVIDQATWYQSNNTNQGVWQWQGSNDGVTWTNLGSTFTLGGSGPSAQVISLGGNTTPYHVYRMFGISGSYSSSPWDQEMQFQISGINYPAEMAGAVGVATPPPIEAGSNHQAVIAPKPNFVPAHYSPVPVGQVLKTGTLGTAYSETITTQGGSSPYTYARTAGSLPTSLSLITSTGVIGGTPTATGTFSFTIQSTDSGGYAGSTAFQIIISAPARGGGSYTFLR